MKSEGRLYEKPFMLAWKDSCSGEYKRPNAAVWYIAAALMSLSFLGMLVSGVIGLLTTPVVWLANYSLIAGLAGLCLLVEHAAVRGVKIGLKAIPDYLEHRRDLQEGMARLAELRLERANLMGKLAMSLQEMKSKSVFMPAPIPANAQALLRLSEKGVFPDSLVAEVEHYFKVCSQADVLEDRLGIPRTSIKRTFYSTTPSQPEDTVLYGLAESPASADDIRAAAQ